MIMFSFLDLIKVDQKIKKILLFFLLGGLIFFVGFRNEIGTDWTTYKEIFTDIKLKNESAHNVEWGYIILNWALIKLGFTFSQVILSIAILSLGLKFYALQKLTPAYFVAILFYGAYYLTEYEMSGIRQALAMGFALLSLVYARQKRLIPFLICIFSGAIFHVSIIAFIPSFFLYKVRFTGYTYAIFLFTGLLFIFTDISSFILTVITYLPLGEFIQTKLSSYKTSSLGFTIGHIPYLIFAIIFIYYQKVIKDDFYQLLLNGFIIGVLLSFVFSGSFQALNRLTYYYLMLGGLLFSFILTHSAHLYNKLIFYIILSVFSILKIADSINEEGLGKFYIPYNTIFKSI